MIQHDSMLSDWHLTGICRPGIRRYAVLIIFVLIIIIIIIIWQSFLIQTCCVWTVC